jgi:general secretion pathway protein N
MMRYGALLGLAAGLFAMADVEGQVLLAAAPLAGDALENGAGLGPVPGVLGPGPITPQPAGGATKADPPTGNPLWGVTLESLSATRNRPIFAPSRRPPPPPVLASASSRPAPPPPKPAEPDRPLLSLVGTVIGEGESVGVFQDEATKTVVRLRVGEGYTGWILRAVRGREASFDKGTQVVTLALPTRTGEPAPQPGPGGTPASVAQTAPSQRAPAGQTASPAPAPKGSGTWMDGDGQMIAPPPGRAPMPVAAPQAEKASQPLAVPIPAAARTPL